ncbi:hypothetical protein [Moorena producens]|uniref:hypothetical protein n=1 Tax=Moorena producens TaxID=1155739 RepID=UPI003C751579
MATLREWPRNRVQPLKPWPWPLATLREWPRNRVQPSTGSTFNLQPDQPST